MYIVDNKLWNNLLLYRDAISRDCVYDFLYSCVYDNYYSRYSFGRFFFEGVAELPCVEVVHFQHTLFRFYLVKTFLKN